MDKVVEFRDVVIKRNGTGYLLQTGSKIEKVTPTEIERLMESILRTHPGVPDGVAAAWDNRFAPVIEVSEYVGVIDMEIVPVGYQATILIVGIELSHMRTETWKHPELAVEDIESRWGCELHVLPEFNRLNVSSKKAKDELLMKKAEEFCREKGITMEELWEQVTGEQDG